MKKTIFYCYRNCGMGKKNFIELVKKNTGLTDSGIKNNEGMQIYIDTLHFTH